MITVPFFLCYCYSIIIKPLNKSIDAVNSNNALYDVYPLPKHDVPLHISESSAGLGDILEVPIINLSIENDLSPATDTVTPPLDANSSLSHADSFYYTPDITTETLSEVCLD